MSWNVAWMPIARHILLETSDAVRENGLRERQRRARECLRAPHPGPRTVG